MQAADAYAFGILLWELYTCSRAWANLTHVQVLPSSAVCMHIDQKLHAIGSGCVSVLKYQATSQKPKLSSRRGAAGMQCLVRCKRVS